jgi:hypothetical protein
MAKSDSCVQGRQKNMRLDKDEDERQDSEEKEGVARKKEVQFLVVRVNL